MVSAGTPEAAASVFQAGRILSKPPTTARLSYPRSDSNDKNFFSFSSGDGMMLFYLILLLNRSLLPARLFTIAQDKNMNQGTRQVELTGIVPLLMEWTCPYEIFSTASIANARGPSKAAIGTFKLCSLYDVLG